ncbi:MAG: hypothetical protein DSZ27_08505 [Thiomicrospira sp.]|nr:MAG: hypothetical protein DSZ27_08505 [Thiomicrospira sp.]
MQKTDVKAFSELLTRVGKLYKRSVDTDIIGMYFRSLSSLSFEEVEKAIDSHMADTDKGQYFPKPADIMRNAQRGKSPIQIQNEQVAHTWLSKKMEEHRTGIPAYSATQINQSGATL